MTALQVAIQPVENCSSQAYWGGANRWAEQYDLLSTKVSQEQSSGVSGLHALQRGKVFEVWALQTKDRSLKFEPYKQRKGVWSLSLTKQRKGVWSLQPYRGKFAALQRKGEWGLQPYRGKECEVCSLTEERRVKFAALQRKLRSFKSAALQRKGVLSLQPYRQRKGVWSLQPYRGKECEVCSLTNRGNLIMQ